MGRLEMSYFAQGSSTLAAIFAISCMRFASLSCPGDSGEASAGEGSRAEGGVVGKWGFIVALGLYGNELDLIGGAGGGEGGEVSDMVVKKEKGER